MQELTAHACLQDTGLEKWNQINKHMTLFYSFILQAFSQNFILNYLFPLKFKKESHSHTKYILATFLPIKYQTHPPLIKKKKANFTVSIWTPKYIPLSSKMFTTILKDRGIYIL